MFKFLKKNFYTFIFLLMFSTTQHSFSKTIIWDLGETLFTISRLKIAYKIGISHFISYALIDWQNPNIQPIIFDILEKINPTEEFPKEIATDNEGNPLPIIMNKWLAGIISSKELIVSVDDYIEHLDAKNYFLSSRQKELVKRTLHVMFDPETLATASYPIKEAVLLLKECHDALDADGKSKNNLFVLSNWDETSFELFKERNKEFFNTYFKSNRIIISASIGLIKPQKAAFEYLINTYQLDPKECIFIDDSYDNILAAQECGITSLLICKGNYSVLGKILKRLGAL